MTTLGSNNWYQPRTHMKWHKKYSFYHNSYRPLNISSQKRKLRPCKTSPELMEAKSKTNMKKALFFVTKWTGFIFFRFYVKILWFFSCCHPLDESLFMIWRILLCQETTSLHAYQGYGSAFILCGSGSRSSSFSECESRSRSGSRSRSRSSLTKLEEKNH